MIRELLFFKCSVCGIDFMSYVFGKYINQYSCPTHHLEGICFTDLILHRDIHENHYINPINDGFSKCRKCRKSNQLEMYY